MAGRGAHDDDHLSRVHGSRRGRRHMGVDMAHAHRDALGQPVQAAASAVNVPAGAPSSPIGWSNMSATTSAESGFSAAS